MVACRVKNLSFLGNTWFFNTFLVFGSSQGQINEALSEVMILDQSRINIKATTTDRLGVIGEGLGWASMAVVTLIKST